MLVLLTGFEQFNRGLYSRAVESVRDELDVRLFTDRDIGEARLEQALATADVFFASLLFDYDQVAWLNPRLERVPAGAAALAVSTLPELPSPALELTIDNFFGSLGVAIVLVAWRGVVGDMPRYW